MKTAEELHDNIHALVIDLVNRRYYENEVGYFPTYVENLDKAIESLVTLLRP